jgi:hypothetical protein
MSILTIHSIRTLPEPSVLTIFNSFKEFIADISGFISTGVLLLVLGYNIVQLYRIPFFKRILFLGQRLSVCQSLLPRHLSGIIIKINLGGLAFFFQIM